MRRWKEFIRAIYSDWKTGMSGTASILLGAASALSNRVGVVRWSFWVLAGICLVIASFRVWSKERDQVEKLQAEIKQLKDDPLSAVRQRVFRENLETLAHEEMGVLQQIVISGQMFPSDALTFLQERGYSMAGQPDVLSSIERKTHFINGTFHGHYEINPDMKDLLKHWASAFRFEMKKS